jgi:hypothetical protein
MDILLFLPNTKIQGSGGDAIVHFVLRVGRVLERSMGWFVEFQKSLGN